MAEKHQGYIVQPESSNAKKIIDRDLVALSNSYTRSYGLVPRHGRGAEVWDVDEKRYIDFAAGIAVLSTGYGHPSVVQAIQQQAEEMIHVGGTDFFYEAQVEIAEKLQQIISIHRATQPADKQVFLANSGTEAIEAALKLVRYKGGVRKNHQRKYVVAFYGGFHGRTYGALSLTASKPKQRADYSFIPGGVIHIPYPGKFEYEQSRAKDSIEFHPCRFIEKYVFRQAPPNEIAAIFIESIQGEGGYIIPADHVLPELREFCDQHGILLVTDEIQSGMGRTGKWLASEHWNVAPDIVCLAKGLGSGLPIGAIVAHRDIMSAWESGAHANTFGGNLLACRAAVATIGVIENDNLLDNAVQVGAYILQELQAMQREFPIMLRVEGKGLMIGVEFVDRYGTAMKSFRDKLVDCCFLNGLIMLGCGTSGVRFVPPLVITQELAAEGLALFRRSIEMTLNYENSNEE